MKPPSDAPRFRDYLHILARGWFALVCATALSAGIGWWSWQEATPVYQSNTKLLVSTPGGATTFDAFYGFSTAISRALTYQQLARSTQVTVRTIEQLGLPETADGLAGRVGVVPVGPAVLNVVATSGDPVEAREVAQVLTGHLIGVSRQIARVDGTGTELLLVDEAGPAHRVGGSTWRNVVTGGALGLALSALLVIAYALIQDRLLGRGQLERIVEETSAGPSR